MKALLVKTRSFAGVWTSSPHPPQPLAPPVASGETVEDLRSWQSIARGPLHIWFRLRQEAEAAPITGHGESLTWLLGDDAECHAQPERRNLVNAATISYEAEPLRMTLYTSIAGLPPVFFYSDESQVIVASDVYLIAGLCHRDLELDSSALLELAHIGHPIDNKTLFKRTTRLPAGARIVIDRQFRVTVDRAWSLPDAAPVAADTFIDRQIEAFVDAVRRTDVSRSFLSFTAGLDTRTIFTVLADQRRLVPAATMSGPRPSLDARAAGSVCRSYGVAHARVIMGEPFVRRLPEYVQRASCLSGGIASLRQAPEVFFYECLGSRFTARLSGNLGNQVGRSGTEGVGGRAASSALLSIDRREQDCGTKAAWLRPALTRSGRSAIEFTLQHEFPSALAGNYTVGSYFAAQQSPYADRALVETLSLRPVPSSRRPRPVSAVRLKDLLHRFLGESRATSFQRSLLARLGGVAAHYPVNCGWRATGGVSLPGLCRGAAAFIGMIVDKRRLNTGAFGGVVERLGLLDMHTFDNSARWLRRSLREFTCDTVTAAAVREAGIFDMQAVRRVLDEHFTGRKDHFETVTYALDVALAQQLFCSPSARAARLRPR